MTFATVIVVCVGVLVLLLVFGLIRQARRHSYRLRDLTSLSSGIDPDWERVRRTMRRPGTLREVGRDADQNGQPPEERTS